MRWLTPRLPLLFCLDNIMQIKLDKQFPKEANKALTAIAVTLKEVFKSYEQDKPEAPDDKAPLQLPIVRFKPKKVFVGKAKRETIVSCRMVAYAQKPKDDRPCARLVHAHCCRDKETILKEILPSVRDAAFDEAGEHTLLDLLSTLSGIKADKIAYYYMPHTCEGTTTHSMAVVHEFGPEGAPHCVITSYFSVKTEK